MKLLRFIPIKLTALLILGILAGSYFKPSISFAFALTLVFLGILCIIFIKEKDRTSLAFGSITFILTFSIGILSTALSNTDYLSRDLSKLNPNETKSWHIKITENLKSTNFSHRYFANVISINEKKTTGEILISQPINSKQLQIDDELQVIAIDDVIKPPLNPHQFNYQKYMLGLGIKHQINLRTDNYILNNNSSQTVHGIAAKFRNTIISNLKKEKFGSEELAVIQALLLGQRKAISTETYDDYKNAGAVHILAVSGLHIGILLLLLQFLLAPITYLPHGKELKLILTVILLWAFALIAGLSASIVRAVTMFSFVAYAMHLNRPSNTFNILALSMFFILLVFDSNLIFQVGFQMSYAAVIAIVWLYPMLQRFWFPKNVILRKIWQLLSVSTAAQLGVLPISLYYFHQFPGLFFISNLLIVPMLGIILGLGIGIIILSLLSFLPPFLVVVYNALIGLMNSIISWVAEQEVFLFKNISFDGVQLILAYIFIVGLILLSQKPNFKRILFFGSAILVFQLYTFRAIYAATQKQELIIAHQTKNTILINRNGNQLQVLTKDSIFAKRIAEDYKIAERIALVKYIPIKNSYTFKTGKLYRIDSLGIYPPDISTIDYLLLSQSPKINLERFIDSAQPKQIIADGSNYRSYINRWQQTCLQKKIPFHYTGEKGSFYFD